MLYFDISLILAVTGAVLCCLVRDRPRQLRDAPRDVLICAAHSDDCVIIGAEYAWGSLKCGRDIRIVYLTCSGPHPDTPISHTRKMEALAAWATMSVPANHFTFINLPQSPVRGPKSYSDADVRAAIEVVKSLVSELSNPAMIIPAYGESHVDHNALRCVCLQAIRDVRRKDIVVYESPEYNVFLSLLHCPRRTIRTMARCVPLMTKFIRPYLGPANYVSGPAGCTFQDSTSRLLNKITLLGYFSSQEPSLLVRYFGHKTRYRKLMRSDVVSANKEPFSIRALGGYCDTSALLLGAAILLINVLTTNLVAKWIIFESNTFFSTANYLAVFSGAVASIYLIRTLRRTVSLETCLFVWAAAIGLLSGCIN
jgi:LmbE family N-acetylglucosaminyl deacetylase